jgi:alpha-methylacyl-CoA racemase
MTGPLHGVRVLELTAIGPVPFCGALLADLGADVVRIDRKPAAGVAPDKPPRHDFYNRNKRSLALDLKAPAAVRAVLQLLTHADVLIEGWRPGVAERLGLGPKACQAVNPKLVYGRMTGWGQTGPLAQEAGHDINYLALTGALHSIGGPGQPPTPPLNLVADLGGGAMVLAVGVLSAVIEARTSGRGQVVDAAMVDGVALLMSAFQAIASRAAGPRTAERTWSTAVPPITAPTRRRTAGTCRGCDGAGLLRQPAGRAGAGPGHAAGAERAQRLAGLARPVCRCLPHPLAGRLGAGDGRS